jgi:GTPase SAR1 family protein
MASKLAFLGGNNSGKSELFYIFNDGSDITHSTTSFTHSTTSFTINGVEVSYHLWNVRQETTNSERGQSRFSKTDVFLLCFSLHNRKSFEDIRILWLSIVKEHPTIPVVLLGINTLPPQDALLTHKEVTVREIEDFQLEARFEQYLECQIQAPGAIDKFFKELSQLITCSQKRDFLIRDNSLVSISTFHSHSAKRLITFEIEKDKKKLGSSNWKTFFSCWGSVLHS